jgi:hypothetical protein
MITGACSRSPFPTEMFVSTLEHALTRCSVCAKNYHRGAEVVFYDVHVVHKGRGKLQPTGIGYSAHYPRCWEVRERRREEARAKESSP